MDVDVAGEHAEDPDFDMFLDEKEDGAGAAGAEPEPAAPQETFDALPQVWTGTVRSCFFGRGLMGCSRCLCS